MKKIFFLLLASLFVSGINAQSGQQLAMNRNVKTANQGVIVGKVIEAGSSTPIEYAGIVLLSKQNSQMVSGVGFTSNLNVRPEVPVFNLSLSYNFNNFRRRSTEQVDVNVNSGL